MEPEAPFVGLTYIDGTMTTGQVALAVLRKHFLVMLAKCAGTLEGSDPEDLHDMRVATRRIRAATSLFRPFISEAILRRREEFAWLGQTLGNVRDLDVQLEHIEEWSQAMLPVSSDRRAPVLKLLAKRREAARKEMTGALCSDRYTSLADDLTQLLKKAPTAEPDPLAVVAGPELIEKRMRSFRKATACLTPDDPPESFHLARIRGKKLRYAMEFLAPLYGKIAKDASLRIVAVQDLLGLHQDCVVAIALVDEVAQTGGFDGQTMFFLGMLRQLVEDKAAGLRVELPPVFKESHGKEWRDLREAMKDALPREPELPDDRDGNAAGPTS